MLKRVGLLAVVALVVGLAWSWIREEPPAGPAADEAHLAGWAAEDFPQPAEDWFHDMDGGVELSEDEIRGRNTWLVWTGGNEAMWNYLANNSFGAFDLLKTLSSHPDLPAHRGNRASWLGLWNEPGFEQATGPDPERYGLWLDRRVGDWAEPFEDADRYPGVAGGSAYGAPSGVVGLRLFPNPAFDDEARSHWDAERYYRDPEYYLDRHLVRPYRVGMSCGFCHVGPSPTHPPVDPENPEWADLSSYVGAQYFWNGRIFFYDPNPGNFVSQLFSAPRPGTLDTSFVATDNIFNPRTMNALYEVGARLEAAQLWGHETLAGGALDNHQLPDLGELVSFREPDRVRTPHVLKDGADSAGVIAALNRVYLNVGTYHEEWFRHFKPLIGGKPQSPIEIGVARRNSTYWNATEDRALNLARFFVAAARPHRLADAPGGAAWLEASPQTLDRGREVFAENCARCHSSELPQPPEGIEWFSPRYRAWTETAEWRMTMTAMVKADDFLEGNYLSNDHRIPAHVLGTNLCSPLASNAIAGHVWDNFSSATYKSLPSIGTVHVPNPFDPTIDEPFEMPGGGRGYTRVPSLISLWSTAPYLLNNTLGPFVADPGVAGRMASFEASIELLLWPEKREPFIARTTAPSQLEVGVAYLEPPFNRLVGLFSRWFGNGVIEIGPIPRGTPIGLLANIELNNPAKHRKLLGLLPTIARSLARIKVEKMTDAEAGHLLAEELAPRLLDLSACPDLVMNRGHEFGSELSEGEKLALVEYLKTL